MYSFNKTANTHFYYDFAVQCTFNNLLYSYSVLTDNIQANTAQKKKLKLHKKIIQVSSDIKKCLH